MRQDVTASVVGISKLTVRDLRLISAHGGRSLVMKPDPDKLAALVDSAQAFETAGIEYALIGGVAVGIHSGTPRATLDVDIACVSSTRARVTTVLEGAGFRRTGEFPHSLNFRHSSGEPLQIAFDVGFDELIARAVSVQAGGTTVAIVTKEDLIAMKVRAAVDPARRKSKRLRDEADVELLRGDVPDPDEGW